MTRFRRRAALLPGFGLALAASAALLLASSDAAAQGSGSLDLQAQTLFVDDDPAEIVIRVSGAPESAHLRFTIYDTPVLTRNEVRDHHENPPSSGRRIANFECTLDGDCRDQATMTQGPDNVVTVTLNDDEIGVLLRQDPGVLPFVVQLVNDDDETLDELATSLIVLEDETPAAGGQQRVRVAFLSQVLAPVALQPDLRTRIDVDAVLDAAGPLAAYPDLAVTTEVRPETLEALANTDPDALDELLEILGGRPLLRSPWVDMDEEAWRLADESDQVISQYARGNDTLESLNGAPPTDIVRLDSNATPETLTLLRTAGAASVVVADTQLSPSTRAATPNQPFQILDSNGVAMTALRVDEALHDTLSNPDPELAAYRAIAELTALAEEATTDLGVLLDLDRVDHEALGRLLDGIDDRRSLRVFAVETLAQRELARLDGVTLRGVLAPTAAGDVSELAADLESATAGVATLARMFDPEIELVEPFVNQLQAAVSADLDASTAGNYVSRIGDEIRELSSGIEIAESDRITLTDRRTDLPLTIVNGQPLPLNVELLLTAEKIRFPDGDRLSLTLAPGENELTIPVETLASGDARVTATVVSPGGFFELGSGTVDIRSTAISGLGLIISVVALIVLAVWWIRTILRVRLNRVAATVSAASVQEVDVEAETPIEGES